MKSQWQDESIAPNGCPVKENCGRWFGDSVVTENGKPRIVYHGTDADFEDVAADVIHPAHSGPLTHHMHDIRSGCSL